MELYNWQKKEWPQFTWSDAAVEFELLAFIEKSGRVSGMLKAIPDEIQSETLINLIVSEALKTSEIEGEYLNRTDVLSSVRRNMGLAPEVFVRDKRAQGVSSLMIEVRNTFAAPLSEKMLLTWHSLLLNYRKDMKAGSWRTDNEPMQVISGAIGKVKIHFEAPPAVNVPGEMKKFIEWFNETGPGGKKEIKKGPVRSAIAHLYFESVHPFEDGNGRIGRVLADKALSQAMGHPVLLSLSKAIEENKKDYYAELKKAQRTLNITSWINYFIRTLLIAQTDAEAQIDFVIQKMKFFDKFRNHLNERQLKAVKRMLEGGSDGFIGGMNAGKYSRLCKISKATATRDLQYLSGIGALEVTGRGRNTSYQVNLI